MPGFVLLKSMVFEIDVGEDKLVIEVKDECGKVCAVGDDLAIFVDVRIFGGGVTINDEVVRSAGWDGG